MAENQRLQRERRTIRAMIHLYCRANHHSDRQPCADCGALEAYAMQRLDRCVFGSEKPTCANCPVHCYRPEMRERVRMVMGYAGPRMLLKHPYLAILHLLDGKRPVPQRRNLRR